jgi:predicted transcriptional regulator
MDDSAEIDATSNERLVQVVDIVSAFVSHNPLSPGDLPRLIVDTHRALRALSTGEGQPGEEQPVPAVPVRKSVTAEFLICLDDGKKFKSLKRHLAGLGMTPDDYRAKWGLPPDYPMVAANYAATRSLLAKSNGLGRKQARLTAIKRPARPRGDDQTS